MFAVRSSKVVSQDFESPGGCVVNGSVPEAEVSSIHIMRNHMVVTF